VCARSIVALLLLLLPAAATAAPEPVVRWARAANADAVAFSSDGRYVATGAVQSRSPFALGRIDLWDATDGTPLEYEETDAADTAGATR